jgi:hypothetical protein
MKCATCGDDHELLEPTFRRPGAVVALSKKERTQRVKEGDDLCVIRARGEGDRHRCFIRCVLNVPLLDADGQTAWGLWVELELADFRRIVEAWSDPAQATFPPMQASVANRVPGYPETLGLQATIRLTGPTTRPSLTLDDSSFHPFAVECRSGVCTHRVMEWLAEMR